MKRPARIECPLCKKTVEVDQETGSVAKHTVAISQVSSDQRDWVNVTYTCPLDAIVGEWKPIGRG